MNELVREAGLEPAWISPRDFKSLVSTVSPLPQCFTFSSCFIFLKQWCRLAESNHQPTAYKAVALPD